MQFSKGPGTVVEYGAKLQSSRAQSKRGSGVSSVGKLLVACGRNIMVKLGMISHLKTHK